MEESKIVITSNPQCMHVVHVAYAQDQRMGFVSVWEKSGATGWMGQKRIDPNRGSCVGYAEVKDGNVRESTIEATAESLRRIYKAAQEITYELAVRSGHVEQASRHGSRDSGRRRG